MTTWSEEQLAAHMARINANRPAASVKPSSRIFLSEDQAPVMGRTVKAGKQAKYHAKHCLVTADLTLYVREDLDALAQSMGLSLSPKKVPLKQVGKVVGILGEWFGSLKEGRRYIELRKQEQAGEICSLVLQPRFPIEILPFDTTKELVTVGAYFADFRYERCGLTAIEDCKGVRTPVYRLKKKLVESLYGITITEL